jgi:hypothetical protein
MDNLSRELSRLRKQLASAANDIQSLEVLLAEKKTPEEVNPYLFEEDLAEIFGCSTYTVQRWRKQGKLDPFFRKGRRVFWKRADLAALVKAGTAAAEQE